MIKLLAAVRRALASVGQISWQLIKTAHGWMYNLVRQPPSAEDSLALAQDLVDDAHEADLEKIKTEAPSEVEQIRKLARALDSGKIDYETIAVMSDLQIDWLTALPQAMRTKVRMATDQQIYDHLRGVRTMPGVLRYDAATVADYRKAVLADAAEKAEEELILQRAYG